MDRRAITAGLVVNLAMAPAVRLQRQSVQMEHAVAPKATPVSDPHMAIAAHSITTVVQALDTVVLDVNRNLASAAARVPPG